MANEQEKPATANDTANSGFQIVIGEPSNTNLPATGSSTDAPAAAPGANAGGLSYANARPDEKEKMDKIIASIDLTKPDTIIALGAQEREKLATLADQVLDSIQPGVKLAFAEALKELIDVVKANSLDEVKKRISDGTLRRAGKSLFNALTGRDNKTEVAKDTIARFMTDISGTRKTIQEMTDKLQDQRVELDKNFERINALGLNITEAAQEMRIVRAASAEFIRRVEAGEITTLTDLQKKAQESGRSDDMETYQLAQASWNNLRTVDGDLLGSINVYDMNVANLAFTKQANLQNRIQTATTLTTTIAEWKTELAIFGVVTTENAAAQLLNSAAQLTEQSVKQNKELFDTLVDSITMRSAKGTYNLRQIMETQNSMAAKLETVGSTVEAQFAQLAQDKIALEKSSAQFRSRVSNVYSTGAIIGDTPATPAAAPKLAPPKP